MKYFKLINNLKKLKYFFDETGWDVKLFIFAVIAFVLDVIGFKVMFDQNGLQGNWWDYAYLSIRVFSFDFQTPLIDTPIPIVLEIGRWLSASVTIYAVLIAIKHIFGTAYKLYKDRDNHIVIISLGEKGKNIGLDWIEKDKNAKKHNCLITWEKIKKEKEDTIIYDIENVLSRINSKEIK